MREFIVTVKVREYSGLSALEAQERIRRQVLGLLTGNLEVARVNVRPKEMDAYLEVMSDIMTRIERAEQSAKGYNDLAKSAADRAQMMASKADTANRNVQMRIEEDGCPFKSSKILRSY